MNISIPRQWCLVQKYLYYNCLPFFVCLRCSLDVSHSPTLLNLSAATLSTILIFTAKNTCLIFNLLLSSFFSDHFLTVVIIYLKRQSIFLAYGVSTGSKLDLYVSVYILLHFFLLYPTILAWIFFPMLIRTNVIYLFCPNLSCKDKT